MPWKLPWKPVEVDLLPWKFPWKLVEVDLLPWKLVEASVELHKFFHCRWKWELPLLLAVAVSTNTFRGSFHEFPHTHAYLHLLQRVSQTSSSFHKTSIRVHRLSFDLTPWKFPPTSMETSMETILLPWKLPWKWFYFDWSFHASKFHVEVNFLPWKSVEVGLLPWKIPWKLVEVDFLPWKLVEASKEVHGSFHYRWKWKLPLHPSIAASTNIFRGSRHEFPYTSIYSHLHPRESQTSNSFHKTVVRVHWLPFHPLPWEFHQLP